MGKGRGLALERSSSFRARNSMVPVGHAGVVGFLIPDTQRPLDGDDRFIFESLRQGKFLRRKIGGVKNHLEGAFPIPEIDKDDAAHIPFGLDPAHGCHRLAYAFLPECAAITCSFHPIDPLYPLAHPRAGCVFVCSIWAAMITKPMGQL